MFLFYRNRGVSGSIHLERKKCIQVRKSVVMCVCYTLDYVYEKK